jgi:hypothetical protein
MGRLDPKSGDLAWRAMTPVFLGAAFLLVVSVAGLALWRELMPNQDRSAIIRNLRDQASGSLKANSSARSAALALIPPPRVNNAYGSVSPLPGSSREGSSPPTTSVRPVQIAPASLQVSVAAARSSPDYPFFLVRSAKPADLALANWLARWKQTCGAGRPVTSDDLALLKAILERAPLSSISLLELSRAFHSASQDPEASAIFYVAATDAAAKELNKPSETLAQALPVLHAIQAAYYDYQKLLWGLFEQSREKRYVDSIYLMYTNFIHWAPRSDSGLYSTARSMKIGLAECNYLSGRYAEAARALEALQRDGEVGPGRQLDVDWLYGSALYQMGRFSEAVVPLTECARHRKFKFSNPAGQILADLAASGR